jgi:hypothetical protein
MIRPTKDLLIATAAFGILAFAAPATQAAGLSPTSAQVKAGAPDLTTSVRHRRWREARYRYARRPYVVVRPEPRGFYDQGYAYHGSINGCAVDLGYGRYESCNAGR